MLAEGKEQNTEIRNIEDDISYASLLDTSQTTPGHKSNARMTSSLNRSKLHCDSESAYEENVSLPVSVLECDKSLRRKFEFTSLSASVYDHWTEQSFSSDDNQSFPSRTNHVFDHCDTEAPVSKQARISLCSRIHNLSLACNEQSDSSLEMSGDGDTLKADSLQERTVLTTVKPLFEHEVLEYQGQKETLYFGKQNISGQKPVQGPEQLHAREVPLFFWNINSGSDELIIKPDTVLKQDQDGDTILHSAIINENISVVKEVLRIAPHSSALNILNNMQQTALHLAVLTHQPHIVRLLISRGACIEIRDRNGNTALHLACKRGCLTCVQQLTKPLHQTEVDGSNYHVPFQRIPQDPTLLNYDGQSCVHMAADSGCKAVLDYLLLPHVGHDVNIKHGRTGRTILHEAVCSRNLQLVIHLLKRKDSLKLDIDCEAFDGCTAFQMALCNGNKEAALLLKKFGAVEAVSSDSDD